MAVRSRAKALNDLADDRLEAGGGSSLFMSKFSLPSTSREASSVTIFGQHAARLVLRSRRFKSSERSAIIVSAVPRRCAVLWHVWPRIPISAHQPHTAVLYGTVALSISD